MASIQRRVLIVDDEEDLTWTLSKKLSKDSDKFQLVCVNSGSEAIEVMNQLPVDLVITDVRMPEVSGLELLVQIKDRYPQTRVIIMTAYGSDDVKREANQGGCFRYIEKPFAFEELAWAVIDGLDRLDEGVFWQKYKAGKVEFRNDSGGNVHALVGKLSFDQEKLVENLQAFIDHVTGLKPTAVRGQYVKGIAISATMTPGVRVAA